MTKKEANALIKRIGKIEETTIEVEKQREQIYKEAIFSCDPERLVSILKTLHRRSEQRAAEGKKNTTVDERYYRLAEKNLHSELAFALQKDMAKIREMIMKQVEDI